MIRPSSPIVLLHCKEVYWFLVVHAIYVTNVFFKKKGLKAEWNKTTLKLLQENVGTLTWYDEYVGLFRVYQLLVV